eukprot:scaffold105497_cov60-Phaeocystis_antarctica.AAC.3
MEPQLGPSLAPRRWTPQTCRARPCAAPPGSLVHWRRPMTTFEARAAAGKGLANAAANSSRRSAGAGIAPVDHLLLCPYLRPPRRAS